MSKYLLIQSKSPWESGDVGHFYGLARELGNAGGEVTFFLVQNGVTAARTGAKDAAFDQLLGGKVRVLADDFSLRERAIDGGALKPGVKPRSDWSTPGWEKLFSSATSRSSWGTPRSRAATTFSSARSEYPGE